MVGYTLHFSEMAEERAWPPYPVLILSVYQTVS